MCSRNVNVSRFSAYPVGWAIALLTGFLLLWTAGKVTAQCDDNLCGPQSLMVICQHLGIKADVAELAKLSGTSDNGTSLLGLSNAAGSIGLKSQGLKVSLSELTDVSALAVIHLWGNHYVPVESTGKKGELNSLQADGEKVISTPVSTNDWQSQYSGFALVIAPREGELPQFASTTGPDLRVGEYVHYFGDVDEGSIQYTVKYRNAGSQELVVLNIEKSCRCISVTPAVGQDYRLAPGAEGEFTVTIDTENRWGPQDFNITMFSNDPVTPVVELHAKGVVRSKLLGYFPDTVAFGNVRPSDSSSQTIYVPDSTVANSKNYSKTKLEIKSVTSDSPFVVPSVQAGPIPGKPGYTIQALLKPGAPVGLRKGKIVLETTHEKQPRAEIPYTANITGDLEVTPKELFFGRVKSGASESRSLLVSTRASAFKVVKVKNPLRKYISLKVTTVREGMEYQVTARFKSAIPAGVYEKELVIYTNDPRQSKITVPVYALIDG